MMPDSYDRIIFGIMCGFIGLPLYLGYVELAGHEPDRLMNMAIFIISVVLTGAIIYLLSNPKKSSQK